MGKKIVINAGIGGFGLSQAAYARLIELGVPATGLHDASTEIRSVIDDRLSHAEHRCNFVPGPYWDLWFKYHRDDEQLIAVVAELGPDADGESATLKIVEIPDGVEFEVTENEGGWEHIAEVHRKWS